MGGKWPQDGRQGVLIALDRDQVKYLLKHMLTDDLRISAKANGAATVVRKIVTDAIVAHKKASMPKTETAPGWPTPAQLMGRR